MGPDGRLIAGTDFLDMPMARLTLDVTETLATGKWTGIERVVRRLAVELVNRAEGVPPVRLVAAIGGRFHELNATGRDRLFNPGAKVGNNAHAVGNGRLRLLATLILSYAPPLFLAVQARQKERRFAPLLRSLTDEQPVDFSGGDVLLLLDSYWAGTSTIAAARMARRVGARVVSAIYDIIPITHPTYMTTFLKIAFPHYMLAALRTSDAAVAISQYSAAELRHWLGRRLPTLPISWFHLGNDPTASAPTVRSGPVTNYTMIGTIEPRKGHNRVLDAFQGRWASGDACRLTIVGRRGWIDSETIARFDALADEPRLRLVHDADDDRLADILAETDVVIMASRAEGFGLPIVEALALDIPVLASDIEIFREIGNEAILAFDPGDSLALIAAMKTLEADPELYRARARDFSWPSWQKAARELLAAIDRSLRAAPTLNTSRRSTQSGNKTGM